MRTADIGQGEEETPSTIKRAVEILQPLSSLRKLGLGAPWNILSTVIASSDAILL
jgi:hypothetical protein